MLQGLIFFLLIVSSVFLILIVMVQRGKGGGLAGALGGMGGQSALGTKAGDLFTRITIGVAIVWIVTSMVAVWMYAGSHGVLTAEMESQGVQTAPVIPGSAANSAAPASNAPATPAVPSAPATEKPAEKPAK